MKKTIIVVYGLLSTMTIAYGILIWYAIGLVSIFFDPITRDNTILSFGMIPAPFSIPFIAIHWQLLAFLSLIISLVWGIRRASTIQNDSAYILPIIVHLSWILLAIMIHAIGTIS
ncbi:MAG: hypothetical protein QM504_04205, partial [Pseudomonadota bacterium]